MIVTFWALKSAFILFSFKRWDFTRKLRKLNSHFVVMAIYPASVLTSKEKYRKWAKYTMINFNFVNTNMFYFSILVVIFLENIKYHHLHHLYLKMFKAVCKLKWHSNEQLCCVDNVWNTNTTSTHPSSATSKKTK